MKQGATGEQHKTQATQLDGSILEFGLLAIMVAAGFTPTR